MLDFLETLIIFSESKSLNEVASKMRVTQSTVSKRLSSLQEQLPFELFEKKGRRLILSTAASEFLEQVRPLVRELGQAIHIARENSKEQLVCGVSESLLTSWGASFFAGEKKKNDSVQLTLHTHRSPVVIDKVRSGSYQLGFIAGHCLKAPDLIAKEVAREKMVIINPGHEELMCIEESSETWLSIERQCKKVKLSPTSRLESFFAIARLADEGFCSGLVPENVAGTLKISKKKVQAVDVSRPLVIVGRKNIFKREEVFELIRNFRDQCS